LRDGHLRRDEFTRNTTIAKASVEPCPFFHGRCVLPLETSSFPSEYTPPTTNLRSWKLGHERTCVREKYRKKKRYKRSLYRPSVINPFLYNLGLLPPTQHLV
jgi:hypothetical protein